MAAASWASRALRTFSLTTPPGLAATLAEALAAIYANIPTAAEERHVVTVRKLGLAYAPSARFEPFDGFPDFALLQARIDCAPNDAARVAPVIAAIGATLAERGVTNGEFIGARGILRGQLREAFRDNAFVAGLLMRAQERPGLVLGHPIDPSPILAGSRARCHPRA